MEKMRDFAVLRMVSWIFWILALGAYQIELKSAYFRK